MSEGKLNGLDLFSGIGGITYALQDWVRPVAYCEVEPYCQSVLLQRMQEGYLPKAPIWDDIRTLSNKEFMPENRFEEYERRSLFFTPRIDVVTAGFPCQDISVAGAGKGLEGERSGLFFEIMRLCSELRPQFLFLENVPAITSRGGRRVVGEITALGYNCRWCVISAAGVGALYRRERWFLLANSNTNSVPNGKTSYTPMSECESWTAWRNNSSIYRPFKSRNDWQEAVSTVCRVTDGVPNQVDRLKALGNAVVPQQVRKAWKILTGIEYEMVSLQF